MCLGDVDDVLIVVMLVLTEFPTDSSFRFPISSVMKIHVDPEIYTKSEPWKGDEEQSTSLCSSYTDVLHKSLDSMLLCEARLVCLVSRFP